MTATHTRAVSSGARTPLQAARSQRGLTQEQLAYKTGICVATLRRVERGLVRPTRGTKRLLAIALGEPVQRLFPDNESEAAASSAATPRAVAEAGGDHAGP